MNAMGLQYKKTSHILHFLLSLLTGGFWIVVWLACWIVNSNHNNRIQQLLILQEMNRNILQMQPRR